jgi:hypothetical protein
MERQFTFERMNSAYRSFFVTPKTDVIDPVMKDLQEQWRTTGGIQGWEHKMSEASWVNKGGVATRAAKANKRT